MCACLRYFELLGLLLFVPTEACIIWLCLIVSGFVVFGFLGLLIASICHFGNGCCFAAFDGLFCVLLFVCFI